MAEWQSLEAVLELVDIFDELKVSYHVGGSLASSVHGIPRQTNDLDLVVEMTRAAATILTLRLKERFYIDTEMVQQAIQQKGSFNLVHLATGFKVDIFIRGSSEFDRVEFARHNLHRIRGLARKLVVKSAEDTILRKLEWYRLGGEVSDRQWTDILGILSTQGNRLDLDHLRHWAERLEVLDLLEEALTSQ